MHDNHFAHRDLKPGVRLLLSTVIFASNYCVPECPRPARGAELVGQNCRLRDQQTVRGSHGHGVANSDRYSLLRCS